MECKKEIGLWMNAREMEALYVDAEILKLKMCANVMWLNR